MGGMSDLHIEMMNESREILVSWEDLIGRLITDDGYSIEHSFAKSEVEDAEDYEASQNFPDFIAEKEGAGRVAFELKVYRWEDDLRRHVGNAIDHLSSLIIRNGLNHGILIVTWDMHSENQTAKGLIGSGNIDVWDIRKLRSLAQHDKNLLSDLEELSGETWVDDIAFEGLSHASTSLEEDQSQGHDLAKKLRGTSAGKDDWSLFEELCEEAFRLLFSDHITSWKNQNATADGLNRMDLIGRIRGESKSFWSDLSRDFRTRYIVFEAKNYRDKIQQGQVLTTEKYLFNTALRSVALIVARTGVSDQAIKAAHGSLREQGKLIMIIDMEDLCKLLEEFDKGIPPENTLYSIMDNMLMNVGR